MVEHRVPLTLLILALLFAATSPGLAREEPLRAVRLPDATVDVDPKPELGFEVPDSSYPLFPIEQAPFRGARHGFVHTTVGNLAFQVWSLRLPGRMPIEFGLVYDSAISTSMPPPPPSQAGNPRYAHDLGKNWVMGYSGYLIVAAGAMLMATENGDLIYWTDQGGGVYAQQNPSPSIHWQLVKLSPSQYQETRTDGTKWTYTLQTGLNCFGLSKVEDRSGNTITLTYTNGYVSKIQNSDGSYLDLLRPMFDPNYPPVIRHALELSLGVTAVSAFLRDETRRLFDVQHDSRVIHNFFAPVPPTRDRARVRAELGIGDDFLFIHMSNLRRKLERDPEDPGGEDR